MRARDAPADEAPGAVPRPGRARGGEGGSPPSGDGQAADLRGLAQGALHGALQDPQCAHESDQAVRAALRRLCDAAQACGLHAEQLLILLKEAWRELPEARRAVRDGEGTTALAGVITLCIDEYYAPQRQR